MRKTDRGATILEGAIVIPLWLIFFVAMTDIYFMISAYVNLTSFSREALYIGAIMDADYITSDAHCYMSGTTSEKPSSAIINAIDRACYGSVGATSPGNTIYKSAEDMALEATMCFTPPTSPSNPNPKPPTNCGHSLLHDKINLLAEADGLIALSGSASPGMFTDFYTITRRGLTSVSINSTPYASSTATVATTTSVPTLYISARGTFKGMFPLFNGLVIRVTTTGPHSAQLLPTTDSTTILR